MVEIFSQAVWFLQGQAWAPALFVGAYTLACLIAPISLFPVMGGVLFGFWKGLAFNTVSSVLGATLAFFVARHWGREFVLKVAGRHIKRFESAGEDYGFWTLLAVRILGFPPFLVTNYLAGFSGISRRAFLSATMLGILPWIIFITYSADSLWQVLQTSGMLGFKAALMVHGRLLAGQVAAVLFIVSITLAIKRRKDLRRAREMHRAHAHRPHKPRAPEEKPHWEPEH